MNRESDHYKKRGVDYEVPPFMPTLPRKYYQSESIYQEELEKIFYRRWIMACREEEIAEPRQYLTIPVGDESVIVTRGDDGRIYGHFNVCRHRGTRICDKERGRFESDSIKCPYHAWRYDLSGALQVAPLMKEGAGFQKSDFHLFPVHIGLWGGFVFINLSEEPVLFEEELAPLIGKFEAWGLQNLRIAHELNYTLNCNWKIILQNYQECYHCPGVHPLLSKWTPFRGAVHDCIKGAVIGGHMELRDQVGGMTMDGGPAGPPLCNVTGDDLKRVHYYSVFPNLLLSPHPDFVLYHRIRSEGINRIRNDCFFLLHPDSIRDAERMDRFQSAVKFWDMTNREDWKVCEQMQLGLKSRRFKHGRYSEQEDILYALDREVLTALGHEDGY